MKSHSTFRRHPLGEVVARTNEDRHPLDVVPYASLAQACGRAIPLNWSWCSEF